MDRMELTGSVGVAVLLGAFFANLVGWLEAHARPYQALNVVGAALSAYASYGIGFVPFVVLEATWCLVALTVLVRSQGPANNTTL